VRNSSKFELPGKTRVVTGFQKTWSELAVYFDGRPNDPFTEGIGRMMDKSHSIS